MGNYRLGSDTGPRLSKGKDSNQSAGTPQWLFDAIAAVVPFGPDLAASPSNAKCKEFYTEDDNSLKLPWRKLTSKGKVGWCNHPYSNCSEWIEKAYREAYCGASVVQLQPAAFHRNYYLDYAKNGPCAKVVINVPIKFDGYGWSSPVLHAFFVWNKGLLDAGVNKIYEVDPRKQSEMQEVFGFLLKHFA